MKNIVLIEPKNKEGHFFKIIHMPRLGLPLLGTQLKELGYNVNIYAASENELPWNDLLQADLAGISTTTATALEAYKIARRIRLYKIPVIMGGIHATFMPDEALQYADYVIRGEAENIFPQLLSSLQKDNVPENIPGVSFWENGKAVHNPVPGNLVDVNKAPIPDLDLFAQGKPLKCIPVITSRGCPHHCTFCSVTPMFGRRYRSCSSDKVLEEISRYEGKSVFFCDDNFTADLKRSKQLLQGMLENNIKLKSWGAQVRAEVAKDEDFLALMHSTRGDKVYVGLESINPHTLDLFNKKQDLDDIEQCISNFHRFNIRIHGMFILGSDSDSVQTIRDTVKFAQKLRLDSVQFMILTPLPGTPLFQNLKEEGRILSQNWKLYDGHHVVFQPAQMSPETLQEETFRAYKSFYTLGNIFANTLLTGKETAFYRAVGWGLVKYYQKENKRYTQALKSLSDGEEDVVLPDNSG